MWQEQVDRCQLVRGDCHTFASVRDVVRGTKNNPKKPEQMRCYKQKI